MFFLGNSKGVIADDRALSGDETAEAILGRRYRCWRWKVWVNWCCSGRLFQEEGCFQSVVLHCLFALQIPFNSINWEYWNGLTNDCVFTTLSPVFA